MNRPWEETRAYHLLNMLLKSKNTVGMWSVNDLRDILGVPKNAYCDTQGKHTPSMRRLLVRSMVIDPVRSINKNTKYNVQYSLVEEDGYIEKVIFTVEEEEMCNSKTAEDKINKSNPVSHPSHYTDGRIEVIDFIQDKKLNFCRGNIVKYISRAGKKGDKAKEIEDLKKARQYCDFEINRLEGRV